MTTQYDELGSLYEEFSRTPFRQELEFPSVIGALGDVRGLRVLDFACGNGVFSRTLMERGARHVVGLDESAGMLEYARAREADEPLGIRYIDGTLPDALAGTFDLVLGLYILPYATSYEELVDLCRVASRALRPGGRFVTVLVHPELHPDPDHYTRYGFRLTPKDAPGAPAPLTDADPVDLHLTFSGHDTHIYAHYWSADTLELALREAGFGPVQWRRHRTAGSASDVPPGFWEPYLSAPHAAILDTYKEPEPS
ncbi:class I SAM-dependent methyltransferase [Streptomyces sp. NPDC091279]|uniref:class I SAM-dependent methyltransferase n=1 Tax=unclassified Streptomyces TaxID=2593676 RepID=UPI0038026488